MIYVNPPARGPRQLQNQISHPRRIQIVGYAWRCDRKNNVAAPTAQSYGLLAARASAATATGGVAM